MTAFHPEALKAAQAAYRQHALVKEISPGAVEKILAAYLDTAFPDAAGSPEEASRFRGADGKLYVSVTVARSLPFARAVVAEWKLHDGRDRSWMLKHSALLIEASIYDAILDRVRLRLRPEGADE